MKIFTTAHFKAKNEKNYSLDYFVTDVSETKKLQTTLCFKAKHENEKLNLNLSLKFNACFHALKNFTYLHYVLKQRMKK